MIISVWDSKAASKICERDIHRDIRLNKLNRQLNELIDWVVDSMHETVEFLIYSKMNFCTEFIVFNFYYHSRILVKTTVLKPSYQLSQTLVLYRALYC